MRKFQAALCGLLILAVQLFMPTAAIAAAGDVAQSFDSGFQCSANFVAFTATGTTAVVNCGKTLPANHTVQVVVTGGPATCTANLQGDIGGGLYSDLSGSQTCTSSITLHVGSRPVSSVKVNLSALTGGTSPTVSFFYGGK